MSKYNSDIHCKGCSLSFALETETMCDELTLVPVPLQLWRTGGREILSEVKGGMVGGRCFETYFVSHYPTVI